LKFSPTTRESLLTSSRVCVAGIARIYLYRDYFTSKDVFCTLCNYLCSCLLNFRRFVTNNVLSDNGAALFVLSSIECNLAILCGSLPGIRPLISQFVSRAAPTLSPDDRPPRQRAPGRVPNATETSASAGSWVILSIRAPEQRMIHMKEGRHYSVLDEDSRKETSRKADEDEERLPKKDSSH
jgi:hypothetical protein